MLRVRTVSYTHLDVYKRQADSHTIKIVSEEKSAVDAFIYLSITEKNGIYTINSDNEKFITYSEKPTYEQADGAIEGDIALLKDNTSAQLDFLETI